MPRKMNTQKSKKENSKHNLIATRLIQISLIVDDLIYKNRPIALENARSNLREISGYKDVSQKDPRSMQVIEKLTRIMKGIIDDNSEPGGGSRDILIPPPQNNMEVVIQKAISSLSINESHESPSIDTIVPLNTNCTIQAITSNEDTNISVDINESDTKPIQLNTTVKDQNNNSTKESKVVKKRHFKPPLVAKKEAAITQTATDQTCVSLENNSSVNNEKTSEDQATEHVSVNNEIKPKQYTVKRNKRNNNTKKNKPTPEIYNKSIENDLSWIENIRFVREITTDENDPKFSNLGAGFWDNLETPHVFDQQDFDN